MLPLTGLRVRSTVLFLAVLLGNQDLIQELRKKSKIMEKFLSILLLNFNSKGI